MSVILFFAVLFLFLWIFRLQARVDALEERQPEQPTTTVTPPVNPVMQETTPMAGDAQEPEPNLQVNLNPVTPPRAAPVTAPLATPTEPPAWITWWQVNPLIKIGAVLFFLGAVWFVSYAVAQGWVSPTLRIFLGLALGLLSYAVAHYGRTDHVDRYLTLTALGSGIIFATIFAGQFVFDLFDPTFAFLLLILTVAYTVYVSLQTETQWLAITAVIAALIAPQLINEPNPNAFLLYCYLIALAASFLMVLVRTNWRSLVLALSIGFVFYQLQIADHAALPDMTSWVLIVISSALLYGASTFMQLRSRRLIPLDVTTLGINVLTLTLWSMELIDKSELVVFVLAALTALTGWFVYERTKTTELTFVHGAFAIMLGILGTQLTFSEATLTMVYTLEATVAFATALYLGFSATVVRWVTGLYLLPVLASFTEIVELADGASLLSPPAIALYLLTLAGFFAVSCTLRLRTTPEASVYMALAGCFSTGTYLYAIALCALIWNSVFADMPLMDDVRTVLTYLSWALISYLAVRWSLRLRLPLAWLKVSLATWIIPLTLSLGSFFDAAWRTSAQHPHAIGLYMMTTFMVLFALVLFRDATTRSATTEIRQVFLIGAGLYAFTLVWKISHALITVDDYAVTVALVIYTIAGLYCYLLGKQQHYKLLKIVGVLLLGSVILRLGLVDIWEMEVFWRIIAFFGIGALFMAAAFFEKPFANDAMTESLSEG